MQDPDCVLLKFSNPVVYTMADDNPTMHASSATQSDPSSASPQSSAQAQNPQPESESSTSSKTTSPACAQCGKSPDSLKQCIKCHSVTYCNKDCQKAHFKAHKKACPILAQEYVKLHEPKMASRSSGAAKGEGRDRGLQKWQVCLLRRGERGILLMLLKFDT